jgi:hypothetical protein
MAFTVGYTFGATELVTNTKLHSLVEDAVISGTAPATAAATGTKGEIRIADGFIYICVDTNTWQKVAIATW